MKYFSMFSGIGGFDLALNRNGHQCIGYSEIDKYSIQIYKKNFGEEVKNYGDATKINPDELPDFDLLCGGFPCQSFSIAGKRRGFEDTRGTLFFDIARIIKVKRPSYLFLENVKGLLNHNQGETFKVIIQTLSELGYDIQWMVLNSKFFGVPQNRERVFIIGNLRGKTRPEILPFGTTKGKDNKIKYVQNSGKEKGIIYNSEGISNTLTVSGSNDIKILEPKILDLYNQKIKDECCTLTEPHHNNIRVLEPIIYPTLTTELAHSTGRDFFRNGGQKMLQCGQIRKLTPLECERLQGFPDKFTEGVSNTQRYKQCGNAVTVNVIKEIIKKW